MIEKILERLEAEAEWQWKRWSDGTSNHAFQEHRAFVKAIQIVQEVAKEYGYGIKLNRCDTCTHYVADVVPPICYFCCKGMEDNYEQKGE